MSNISPQADESFSGLGLTPKLLAALDRLKFTTPTPIQRQAIPVAAAGKDVMGVAQTGTGKTLAFALPLIQQMAITKKRGLILLPTRELAMQVEESLRQIGQPLGLRCALLIGGASMSRQVDQLMRRPHIVIGTPGRMIDHLERGSLKLADVGILVLDEADRMLDMGFAPQIKRILQTVPRERQTMLFSATMPPEIVRLASEYMKMPVRIEVAPAGTITERVNQELIIIPKDQKNRLLDKLLTEYTGTVLVFARTKYGAKKICRAVRQMGHSAAEIHSNLSLSQRRRSLDGFKSGKFRVLVATDIAARGIDVTNIQLVVNYDLPDSPDDYVHRVGRTGRAGKVGQAISFITPDQRGKVRNIERLVRQQLRISAASGLPAERAQQPYRSETEQISPTHRRTRFRDTRPRMRKARPERSRQRTNSGNRPARIHL